MAPRREIHTPPAKCRHFYGSPCPIRLLPPALRRSKPQYAAVNYQIDPSRTFPHYFALIYAGLRNFRSWLANFQASF